MSLTVTLAKLETVGSRRPSCLTTVLRRGIRTSISEVSKRVPIFPTCNTTVRRGGIETGISEASKRVSIFSFVTQGGK